MHLKVWLKREVGLSVFAKQWKAGKRQLPNSSFRNPLSNGIQQSHKSQQKQRVCFI